MAEMLKADLPIQSIRILLQFLADIITWSSNKITITDSDASSSDFAILINTIVYDSVDPDFKSQIFCKVHLFLIELCNVCNAREILSSNWLKQMMLFLWDMHINIHLRIHAAYLSLPFVLTLHKICCNLNKVIEQTEIAITTAVVTEIQSQRNRENNEQRKLLLQALLNYWENFFKMALPGIQVVENGPKILSELCNLLEKDEFFYEANPCCLDLYSFCFSVKNASIRHKGLSSIRHIFENDSISMTGKKRLVEALCRHKDSNNLYQLLKQSNKMIKETLIIIDYLHDFLETDNPNWNGAYYNQIYMFMTHGDSTIRRLAGKFFVKQSQKTTDDDDELILDLLDYYVQFNSNPIAIKELVDSVWEYDFIKEFERIIGLFGLSEDQVVCDPVIAHFIVEVVKHLVDEGDCHQLKILNLFKCLPLLLTKMEDSIITYGILLQVFTSVELILYQRRYIGHDRYVKQLIGTIKNVFLSTDIYRVQKCILYIFEQLQIAGFDIIPSELSNITTSVCEKFIESHMNWSRLNLNEDFDEKSFHNLKLSTIQIAVLTNRENIFDETNENTLFNIFCFALLVDKRFENMPEQFYEIEAYYIECFSNLLKRQVTILLRDRDNNISIGNLRKNIMDFIKYLRVILQREQLHIFWGDKVFSALIHMQICVQNKLLYSYQVQLHQLVIPLSIDLYNELIDYIVKHLFSTDQLDENNNLFLKEAKINIFNNFIMLHEQVIDIPKSNRIKNILVNIAKNSAFEKEMGNFILAFANYKSPTEKDSERFSHIYALVLYKLHQTDKKQFPGIIKKIIQFLKSKLEKVDIQIIFTSILNNILKLLDRVLNIPIIPSKPIANRLDILNYLQPFVVNNQLCRTQILKNCNFLNKTLITEEYNTEMKFKNLLLN